MTFFVLDDASKATAEGAAAQVGFPMKKEAGFWYYGRGGYIDIYYEEAVIRRLIEEVGLEFIALRRGNWYRPDSAGVAYGAHQDAFLLRAPTGG